jgi:hypothetical protein
VLYWPLLDAISVENLTQLQQADESVSLFEVLALADVTRNEGQRHALVASLASRLAKPALAMQQWKNAVTADGTNANYRYEYCRSLIQETSYDEAIQQARLGESLGGDSVPFQKIDQQARRLMMKASLPQDAFRSE